MSYTARTEAATTTAGPASTVGVEGQRRDVSALRGMTYAEGAAALAPVQLKVAGAGPGEKDGGSAEAQSDRPTLLTESEKYGDLYGGKKKGVLFDGPPRAHDVVQQAQYIVDCWLVGSMAALAAANPTYIQTQLMQESEGSVTVNLFFARSRKDPIEKCPITISLSELPTRVGESGKAESAYAKTDREGEGGKTILWVAALEMAVAKLFTQKKMKEDAAALGSDFLRLGSGSPSFGMFVLTGKWPEIYGYDGKGETDEQKAERERKGEGAPTERYTSASGEVKDDMPPPVVAWKLKKSLREGQPVTAVWTGHVVAVLAAEGGPADSDVEAWIKSPTPALAKKNDAAMSTFSVTYYNENHPWEGDQTATGWEEIHTLFDKGFRFGSVPDTKKG